MGLGAPSCVVAKCPCLQDSSACRAVAKFCHRMALSMSAGQALQPSSPMVPRSHPKNQPKKPQRAICSNLSSTIGLQFRPSKQCSPGRHLRFCDSARDPGVGLQGLPPKVPNLLHPSCGYDHRISGLGFTDLRLWDLSEVTFRWVGLKALRVPHGVGPIMQKSRVIPEGCEQLLRAM